MSTSTAFTADLIGQASIIDGDTLEIHGTRIRLWGIDAPESSQRSRGHDLPRASAGPVHRLLATSPKQERLDRRS